MGKKGYISVLLLVLFMFLSNVCNNVSAFNIPDKVIGAMSGQRPIWFHASSVGEVIASQKLLEGIRERFPDRKLLVSTFTPTGNVAAKEKLKADGVIFLPLDFPLAVSRAVKKINP